MFALAGLAGTAAADGNDAAAPSAAMRSISVSTQGDAKGNQALQTTLSLPLGQRGFVQLGAGQTRSRRDAVAHRPAFLSGGLGYVGAGWLASLNATHRADGQAYRQSDGALALDSSHRSPPPMVMNDPTFAMRV